MSKGKRLLPWAVLLFILPLLLLGMVFFSELRAMRKYQPQVEGSGFEVFADVPCNRFVTMEIGFEINPPIPIEKIEHADHAISGDVWLSFAQGEERKIDLNTTTVFIDGHKGVWVKTLMRQPAQWRWWCKSSKVKVKAKNINFDLEKHKLMVYVSSDRRG